MFAYCVNNPMVYSDQKGTFPWIAVGIAISCAIIVAVDHWLAANQPNGEYVFETETKPNGATTKGIYGKGSGFQLDQNGIVLCDFEAQFFGVSFESEYCEFEALNVFNGAATAEIDWSGIPSVDISAIASIYNPSIEVQLPFGYNSLTMSLDGYIGAIGVGFNLDVDTGEIVLIPPTLGIGWGFCIDFDA